MANEKTLRDLFHDTLKDIYFAEKKILTALPKMAKAAQARDLKAAFEKHEAETEGHVERLEEPENFQMKGQTNCQRSIPLHSLISQMHHKTRSLASRTEVLLTKLLQ